ncbi:MAG: hypothetical protein BA865_12140 [Desulfobacterales bacterium S5133MH4]|nr:MAG: hypothetical protein BA865_12140 [Desulfobacterales bacterium S5133MH4]
MQNSELFEACLKVRTYECDSYGHANNAVYLNYLEYARMEALNRKGLSLKKMKQMGFLIVVRRIEIDYKAPAGEGDDLLIRTYLKDHNKMKGVFSQEIVKRPNHTLVAKADVTWVFVDLEGRLQPIPLFFQDAFAFKGGNGLENNIN